MLAAALAAILASVAIGQSAGEEPADPLALYDANDNGAIDADEVIQAMTDYRYERIDGALAYRVWRLYEPQAGSTTVRVWTDVCTRYDSNGNGVIEKAELIDAIDDYLFNGTITKKELFAVINCYYSATHIIEIVGLPGYPDSLLADGSIEFTVEASNLVDSGDDSFTISVTTNNSHIGFDGNCTDRSEQVTFQTVSDNSDYSARFTLYACSVPGGTVTANLSLSGDVGDLVYASRYVVVQANRPPTVTIHTSDQTVDGGATVSLDATASDRDGDTLSYSWSGSGSFDDENALDTDWTAPAAQSSDREYVLTVEVSDGSLSASDSVSFTVRKAPPPPDTRPTFGSATVSDQTYDTGSSVSLTLPIATSGDGRLTYAVTGLPPGLSFSGTNRRISGTATSAGSYPVTYSVEDTDGDTAHLRFTISVVSPTPDKVTGLTAMPGSAHGEIALDWDPVNRADSYQVGQWRLQVGNVFSWEVLADSEVTIDVSNTGAVVRGLTPGLSYEHSVRAVRVVGSDTYPGPWADGTTAIAHSETPAPVRIFDMTGYKGFVISWKEVPGASSYLIHALPASNSLVLTSTGNDTIVELLNGIWRVSPGKHGIEVLGPTPYTTYTFSVTGAASSGTFYSARASRQAREPSHARGHQPDHTVGYAYGPVSGVIRGVIPAAADAWNREMNMGLSICDASGVDCQLQNSDGSLATVKTVAPSSPRDTGTGCGHSYACVSHPGPLTIAPSGPGHHLAGMEILFEDPPYGCEMDEDPCESENQRVFRWTDNPAEHRKRIREGPTEIMLLYPLHTATHEFGHTLGLPDFYAHTEWGFSVGPRMDGLSGETAIMNRYNTITDSDIAQLDAIYRLHSRH